MCCKTFASFGSLVAPVDGCAALAVLQISLRGGAVLGVAARNAAPRFLWCGCDGGYGTGFSFHGLPRSGSMDFWQ